MSSNIDKHKNLENKIKIIEQYDWPIREKIEEDDDWNKNGLSLYKNCEWSTM